MKKVKITTFLSILCAVLLFSISTQAQTITLKTLATYFNGKGTGTALDPYKILTANDLEYLAVVCWTHGSATTGDYTTVGMYFQLQNDIDLSSSAFSTNFLPIGGLLRESSGTTGVNGEYAFRGTFDGNGKVISHINIAVPNATTSTNIIITGGALDVSNNSVDYTYTYYLGNKELPTSAGGTLNKKATTKGLALFGSTKVATIKNLGVKNVTITGTTGTKLYFSNNRAGMIGYIDGSTITNCYVEDVDLADGTNYSNNTTSAGFVSWSGSTSSTITNCYAKNVQVEGGYSGCFAGNIVNAIITNCYVSGTSTVTSSYSEQKAGCFAGQCKNTNNTTFINCYTTATIGTPTSGTSNTNNFCYDGSKTNCYYLIADDGTETTNTTVSAKKSATMQSAAFVDLLNTSTTTIGIKDFAQDNTPNVNGGYPIFAIALNDPYTIANGKTLIIPSTAVATDIPNVITIKDGGSLINNGDASLLTDKKINVERKLKAGAWNLVGSVLTSNTMVALNNNAGVTEPTYKHDMAAVEYSYTSNDWNSTTYLTTSSDFTSGKSYFVYPLNRYTTDGTNYTNLTSTDNGYNEDIILTQTKASGVSPNTSSVVFGSEAGNITLDNQGTTTTEKQGYWFALSNPYIGKIDIASFISHNSGINTVISGKTVYTYDATSGWSGQTTGSIYPGQGFMVAKSAKGVLSATIAQSYNSKASNNTIKPLEEMMTFTSNANGTEKKAYVNINAQAENTFDDNDAFVLFSNNNDNFVEPYFVVDNRNIYKNEFKTMPYTTPINFHASKESNTNLTVSNIPNNVSVSIVDLSNGNETALENGSVFNFVVNQGENEGRFVVKFGKKSVSIEDNAQENNISLAMYPNPATSQTTLVLSGVNGNAQVLINDVQGRVVNTYNVAKGQTTLNINTQSLASGVYYVRVISNNTSKTEKLIVR